MIITQVCLRLATITVTTITKEQNNGTQSVNKKKRSCWILAGHSKMCSFTVLVGFRGGPAGVRKQVIKKKKLQASLKCAVLSHSCHVSSLCQVVVLSLCYIFCLIFQFLFFPWILDLCLFFGFFLCLSLFGHCCSVYLTSK